MSKQTKQSDATDLQSIEGSPAREDTMELWKIEMKRNSLQKLTLRKVQKIQNLKRKHQEEIQALEIECNQMICDEENEILSMIEGIEAESANGMIFCRFCFKNDGSCSECDSSDTA